MAIDKNQAMAELARRELSRRSQASVQSNPDYQGGATSPANVKAQQDVKQAQTATDLLDIPIAPMAMANQYAGNIPRMLTGGNFPEATTSGGKVVSDLGGLAGGIVSPVYPFFMKAASKAIDPIKNVIKYSNPKNQIKIADEVQNSFLSAKRNIVDKYGKEYDSIIGKSNNNVDLTPAIKNFMDESQSLMQNPEFSQQVASKNPQAMKIFDMADKISKAKGIDSISAKEADNLSRYIRNIPGLKLKLNQASKQGWHTVQWSNEDRMLLGLADDIKGSVLEAHPELSNLNKEYGQFMNAYKKVAPDFKIGNTIDKIKNYGQYDPQKAQLLEGILPKQTIDKIKEFSAADRNGKLLRNMGLLAGGGALTGIGIKGGSNLLNQVTR